jgi:hypothetical protein
MLSTQTIGHAQEETVTSEDAESDEKIHRVFIARLNRFEGFSSGTGPRVLGVFAPQL